MTDRVGFFAGCADILTDMCVYYVVAGILILSRRGWGLHLFWLLLCAAACAALFAVILKKPRSVPFLTALTGGLFIAVMGIFWLASKTPMRFGYGFVLAVGAGMAVGLPLYNALHRPLIHQHLARLDVLILALTGLLLTRSVLGIDGATVALMVLVLLMDAAGAVGLRMSDGESGDSAGAFRACMIALAAAAALALVIGLMTLLFSKSGDVTGAVLHGIGSFFGSIGRGIERFFRWLTSFIKVPDEDAGLLEIDQMPSLAGMETELTIGENNADGRGAIIALAVFAVIAAIAAAVLLRRRKISRGTVSAVSASNMVKRTGGTASVLWRRLRERLLFAWTVFVNRNTPAGVFILLERRGKRARAPRQDGETMRRFLTRMDPGGGLDTLADALDREYYGGQRRGLSPGQCRELRRYINRRFGRRATAK